MAKDMTTLAAAAGGDSVLNMMMGGNPTNYMERQFTGTGYNPPFNIAHGRQPTGGSYNPHRNLNPFWDKEDAMAMSAIKGKCSVVMIGVPFMHRVTMAGIRLSGTAYGMTPLPTRIPARVVKANNTGLTAQLFYAELDFTLDEDGNVKKADIMNTAEWQGKKSLGTAVPLDKTDKTGNLIDMTAMAKLDQPLEPAFGKFGFLGLDISGVPNKDNFIPTGIRYDEGGCDTAAGAATPTLADIAASIYTAAHINYVDFRPWE